MSGLDSDRSLRLVEARLNRDPQDMLEVAVVLEAWAGTPAQAALDLGSELMAAAPVRPVASVSEPQQPPERKGALLEPAAFVVTVVAIALWAAPLATALGSGVVGHALRVALPLTLALQWGLRRRYLGRPGGLLAFGRHRNAIAFGACATLLAPAVALGSGGTVAGLLTLVWVGGTVLIRRGWYAAYVALVVVATAAMLAGLPAGLVLGAAAAGTALVVALALALRPGAKGEAAAPGRATRAAGAALIGAAVGLLLIGDSSVTWTDGAIPALALLPSTVASVWAGQRLWGLEVAIPRAVAGVAVGVPARRSASYRPLLILLDAVLRLVTLSAALSSVVLLTPWLHSTPSGAGLLAGFALLALATLLAGLLEAMGRAPVAGLALGAGLVAELVVPAPFPGAPLAAGAVVAILIALPVALALAARPARTLATALWIT